MARRRVTWEMGKKYGQGWSMGMAQAEADYREQYHLDGITFPEFLTQIRGKGKITLRHNSYPMILLRLSLINDDVYLIRPIAEKHRWTRLSQWSGGDTVLFVWEGLNAQLLIRRLLRYLNDDERGTALKALKWIPKGGAREAVIPESQPEDISTW